MMKMQLNRYATILDALEKAVGQVGDYVTAGQVASVAMLSRNTAKKYLEMLAGENRVLKTEGTHVNRQMKTGYRNIERCCNCGGTRREESGWTEERGYGALYRHWEILCADCGEYLDGGIFDMQGD